MEQGKNQSIYSDSEQQSKGDKTISIILEVPVQVQKLKLKRVGKEDNISSDLAQEENSDISNRDVRPLCNRPVKTGVQCGICSRWFHYKCEGTRVKLKISVSVMGGHQYT